MLQSDDTLFLNVRLDTASTSICDESSSSSFDSPELNLNRALIASTNGLKRKSDEVMVTRCKKRLLDDVSFGEMSVTDAQKWQANIAEDNSILQNCSNEQAEDPQLYFSSQFQVDKEVLDAAPNESKIEGNSVGDPEKLTLTQMFNDDFDDDIEGFLVECNQSQKFLDVAKAHTQLPAHPSQKLEKLNGTTFKGNNASIYVQLQRSMQLENDDNVNDDNFVDLELSQAIKSTQYRDEIEADFNQCEEVICNIDNLNESKRSVDMNDALNVSDINWNSPCPFTTERTPPTSVVKKRLAEFSKRRLSLLKDQTISSPAKLTSFTSMGPFFGLPTKVQSLIKEYKGIDELYGKRQNFHLFPAPQFN